jgi:hypothetical protein
VLFKAKACVPGDPAALLVSRYDALWSRSSPTFSLIPWLARFMCIV